LARRSIEVRGGILTATFLKVAMDIDVCDILGFSLRGGCCHPNPEREDVTRRHVTIVFMISSSIFWFARFQYDGDGRPTARAVSPLLDLTPVVLHELGARELLPLFGRLPQEIV
jgi:hypothetical protein